MAEKYLSPDQVIQMIPGMTKGGLAQLRFTGSGPRFLKPTAKKVLYRESDIISWLEGSEQEKTGQLVR